MDFSKKKKKSLSFSTYCNKTPRYGSIRRKTAWDLHQTHTQTDRVAASSAKSHVAIVASSSVVQTRDSPDERNIACVSRGKSILLIRVSWFTAAVKTRFFFYCFLVSVSDWHMWNEIQFLCLLLFWCMNYWTTSRYMCMMLFNRTELHSLATPNQLSDIVTKHYTVNN